MEGRMEQESFKLIAGKLFVFIISYYNYQLYVFEDVEKKNRIKWLNITGVQNSQIILVVAFHLEQIMCEFIFLKHEIRIFLVW